QSLLWNYTDGFDFSDRIKAAGAEFGSLLDNTTHIGESGPFSRGWVSNYFDSEGATPQNWADIPAGTRFFVWDNDIDSSGNTNAGAPVDRGHFMKVSHRDQSKGWTGLWFPVNNAGYTDQFYLGLASNQNSFASWQKIALHDTD